MLFYNLFFPIRLQMRLNEMLKQNKDLKSTTSVIERQVDELAEKNGTLSCQVIQCLNICQC